MGGPGGGARCGRRKKNLNGVTGVVLRKAGGEKVILLFVQPHPPPQGAGVGGWGASLPGRALLRCED